MKRTAYGFVEDGKRFVLRDVHALPKAFADVCNDLLYLQLDQRGRVRSSFFLQPNMTDYAEPLRAFYIRDEASGDLWSVPYEPVQAEPDRFEFSIGRGDLAWRIERGGIAVDLRCFVPAGDLAEVWTVTVRNMGRRARALRVCSCLPVGLRGFLAQRSYWSSGANAAVHEYFPYYVHYPDYYNLRKLRNVVFTLTDRRPSGWELSLEDFQGGQGLQDPAGLRGKGLRRSLHPYEVSNERGISAIEHKARLRPGASQTFNFVLGAARDEGEVRAIARRYNSSRKVEAALKAVYAVLDRQLPSVCIRTPDETFNHFMNVWLPRRTALLAKTIRHTFAPQGRNVIQDAMGGVYTLPGKSREWFTRIWRHQHTNGWLPHGMPFAEGVSQPGINKIPHKDINSWGPTALHFYMAETGDFAVLDEVLPFADKPGQSASLYEHICMGLDWLLGDRAPSGLCRIGQGDWNDPLNMAGKDEKGTSTWLTEALAHALDSWVPVARLRGDRARAVRYAKEADRLRMRINKRMWNGRWYDRGFTDAGKAFGTPKDREGKVFLNAQSWAMISGTADARRTQHCIAAVEKWLMTDAGPMVLGPPFTRMREDIGKITQKIPGWNENGSVYCHAALFYAHGLYVARQPEKAFRVLRTLLPGYGRNTVEKCGQLPLFVPNFYRGTASGRKTGQSSQLPNTGTASWYYRTAITMLMGVRAELDGLRIDPQLPAAWKDAQVWRTWRGAEFIVMIERRRGRRPGAPVVHLDGVRLAGNLIPVQKTGTAHEVRVEI